MFSLRLVTGHCPGRCWIFPDWPKFVAFNPQRSMLSSALALLGAKFSLLRLLALDAELVLSSHQASRTLPLSEFILGNRKTARRTDELLTSIRVPRRIENAASTFLKLGARRYLVISIVMVAANLVVDSAGNIREALVCVGSCSAAALRLAELERALVGQAAVPGLGKVVRPEQLTRLSPIDDVRATAEYRRDAALTLVGRALEACAQKAVAA